MQQHFFFRSIKMVLLRQTASLRLQATLDVISQLVNFVAVIVVVVIVVVAAAAAVDHQQDPSAELHC